MKFNTSIYSLLFISLLSCAAPETDTTQSTKESGAENQPAQSTYQIAFYNVENLFDTEDDPFTEDEWFLPTSETAWDDEKYAKKLNDLAKVIDKLNEQAGGPDLIGLCEVENQAVVFDLAKQKALADSHYEVVHYDSPDTRGIDVAAMYNSDKFELIDSRSIFVSMPEDPAIKTRDILYCEFKIKNSGETLHYYVNHWSSRRKGEAETFFKRKNCAETLKNDLMTNIDDWKKQRIIIVGDMNDYPDNESIYSILGATENTESDLINIQYNNHQNGLGTYNYKGEWGCLDNVIVTQPVYQSLTEKDAKIFSEDWIMYTNNYEEKVPNKTYGGSNYYGGYSDHLPVYFEVKM